MRKSKVKMLVTAVIMLSLILTAVQWESIVSQAANDNQLSVYMSGSAITSARRHISFLFGKTSGVISYKYTGGVGVKTATYSSTNTKVFTIINQKDGTCQLQTLEEGTGYLELKITTYNAISVTERVFISVYSPIDECGGVIKTKTNVYRAATTNAGVENDDKKGELAQNSSITIYGECDSFYVIKQTLVTFVDGFQSGFVPKSAVTIPPTKLLFDDDEITLAIGQSETLETSVKPELAYEPAVTFTSANPRIAKVDSKGVVTGVKVGETTITAKSTDGKLSATCVVEVTLDEEDIAWSESNANKSESNNNSSTGSSGSSKASTTKKVTGFQVKVQGIAEKKIRITWNKQSGAKKYEIQRKASKNGKLKKIATVKKSKTKYTDKKVKKNKKYWYRVVAKKSKKKKDIKSKFVSGKGENLNVDFSIKLLETAKKEITLSWKEPKYTDKYVVQRKEGNGAYKKTDEFAYGTKEYVDSDINYHVTYKYRVIVYRTVGKTLYSNEVSFIPTYPVDKAKNIAFFKSNYSFVCTDASKDMNQYSVYSGYYSPIKYKFTGDTLEIHLYLEFTRYDEQGKKASLEAGKGIGNESYVDLFKEGVGKWHGIDIVDNPYEFQGINFRVIDIIHDKNDKETYNSKQKFNEVLIGGIDPTDEDREYWYHTRTGGKDDTTSIYMPYIEKADPNLSRFGHVDEHKKKRYLYISAHETGHVLGLDDAYTTDEKKFGGKYDRFCDNPETGSFCERNIHGVIYDNLMVERKYEAYLHANDVQMMLAAYLKSNGKPWTKLESYKTVPELGMGLSSVISNSIDNYKED